MGNVETSMPASSQSITMRPVGPDDEDFLAQLFASTRPEFSFLDLPESQKQFLMTMQFNAQRQQYDASYPEAESAIILLHGQPIGRMLVDRNDREFTLIDIALSPEHRNAGIGTNLISEFLNEARAAGKPVRLHVAKSNPAQRLYQRLGFSLTADQSMYFEMIFEPLV
jgi:ribosomal protein S18 acetylase RimI-like enzyme